MINYIAFDLRLYFRNCELTHEQLTSTLKHLILHAPNLNFDFDSDVELEITEYSGEKNGK